jgi:ATP-dependent RNA helicase DeaD
MTLNARIAPALARALEAKGFTALTEVQEAVLAADAAGRDLLVSAQTGSGKTVAFGMAMAPALLDGEEELHRATLPMALVIAPTRELALQVERELGWLFGQARGRIASCVGGMDARSERRALERGCHIVVGTPGRLRDHIERGALDMSQLRVAVLDEADEMLDFGFREDLEYILDAAPAERQTMLFSATVPRSITDIARRYQRDAVRISTVNESQQHADIEYRALEVAPSDIENAIINTLRFYDSDRAIVFCATRDAVNRLSSRFGNRGFSAVALSGELSQKERTQALQALRDGRARVCIATDVAARGIDLPGLNLVIHADLPQNSDVLKHRSGRTGRAGQKGVCALIVPHTRRGRANRLLRDAKIQAEWAKAPSLEDIKARDRQRTFEDPSLSATHDEAVLKDAKELLERYGAEQIAAAFLVGNQKALPAAEDLLDAPAHQQQDDRPRRNREDFNDGVWFRMTTGRKDRAEPRWLLPLICRLGHVTKREVGSIQIGDAETRFQITKADAERFMVAVKASGGGEKSIRILPDDGSPIPTTGRTEPSPDRAPQSPRARMRQRSQSHSDTDQRPPRSDDRPPRFEKRRDDNRDRPHKPKTYNPADEAPIAHEDRPRPTTPKPTERKTDPATGKSPIRAPRRGPGQPKGPADRKPSKKRAAPTGAGGNKVNRFDASSKRSEGGSKRPAGGPKRSDATSGGKDHSLKRVKRKPKPS